MDREFSMRFFPITAILTVLAGPAYAQTSESPHVNLMPGVQAKTPEEKAMEEERDKAYKESLRKIPDAKASSDPWGGVRSGDAPKSPAKASATAKTKTKSGSSAN